MNKYIIIFILFIIVIILLKDSDEKFASLYYNRYCSNCNLKSILNCGECFNCGICIKDNISTCESGDIDGPESKKCDKWIYNSNINSELYYNYYPYYYPYYYNYYYDYPYYRSNYSRRNHNHNKYKSNSYVLDTKIPRVNRTIEGKKIDVLGRGKRN
jgi:hypothetical protein